MSDSSEVTCEQVVAMASAVQLELSRERATQLAQTLSTFQEGFRKVRELDVGDREPATIAYSPGRENQ
jgi:Asp-tRNA(Asn)/Glu-tRNA(Gln) amidotransferase C subunit